MITKTQIKAILALTLTASLLAVISLFYTQKAIASNYVVSSTSSAGGTAILKVDGDNNFHVRFEYSSPYCYERGEDPIESLPLIVNGKVIETLSLCTEKGRNAFFPKYSEDNEWLIGTFFQEDYVTLTQDGFTERFPSGENVGKLYAYRDRVN